jgi:hypothetical protein
MFEVRGGNLEAADFTGSISHHFSGRPEIGLLGVYRKAACPRCVTDTVNQAVPGDGLVEVNDDLSDAGFCPSTAQQTQVCNVYIAHRRAEYQVAFAAVDLPVQVSPRDEPQR